MERKYSFTAARYWKIAYIAMKLREAPTKPLVALHSCKSPIEGLCEAPLYRNFAKCS